MKGNITFKILEAVAEISIEGIQLCEAILVAGYGASPSRIRKILRGIEDRKYSRAISSPMKVQVKNYRKLLSKLKCEGLIAERRTEEKKIFSITERGRSKLMTLKQELSKRLPTVRYSIIRSLRPVIVSFDVPEKEKWKRDWLREVLKNLGLKMVQKSVWIGTIRIPPEFLEDLNDFRMIDYVEIFEVGKYGTIKHLA